MSFFLFIYFHLFFQWLIEQGTCFWILFVLDWSTHTLTIFPYYFYVLMRVTGCLLLETEGLAFVINLFLMLFVQSKNKFYNIIMAVIVVKIVRYTLLNTILNSNSQQISLNASIIFFAKLLYSMQCTLSDWIAMINLTADLILACKKTKKICVLTEKIKKRRKKKFLLES